MPPNVIQKFSDIRIVQSELDGMLQGSHREAITLMFIVIANVPLLYFLNKDWFHSLVFTTPGEITMVFSAARTLNLYRAVTMKKYEIVRNLRRGVAKAI